MSVLDLSNRQISFEELRQRPTLLLEFVKEENPALFESIQRAKRNYNGAVQAKNSLSDPIQIEKMSALVDQAKIIYDQTLDEAEQFAFSKIGDPHNQKEINALIDETERIQSAESAQPHSDTHVPAKINKQELVYRNVAQAMLLSGFTSIVDIARQTGFSLSLVQSTLRSAEFQSFLNLASEQLPPAFMVTGNGRLRELIKQYNQLERIIFERSMAAALPTQVSDSELLELGLSPTIRDPMLSRIPGASQGLITKIPVVSRVMGGEGRGGRSEIVYNYQFDTSLQQSRERLIKEIRTEMAEAGAVAKTKRKTYGFDTDAV